MEGGAGSDGTQKLERQNVWTPWYVFFTFNLNENVPEIFFDVFLFPTYFWGSFQPKKKNIKNKFFAW